MDVNFHKVYMYDHIRQVTIVGDTFCSCKDNGNMHKNPIKAHKGIDNKIVFRALGPDRVPYDVSCNQQVYARIIDPENNTIVIEKLCILGPAKGIITLELSSGDIALVRPGRFSLVLIRTEEFVVGQTDEYIQKPVYSDMDNNVAMELEITQQAFKAPVDSITLTEKDWTPDMILPAMGPPAPCKYSPRIPGARVLNHVNSVHSFSTYTENFTGVLEIWGTLEETPDPTIDHRWFKIYPSTMSTDIEFLQYTGTQAWTFSANFMWLKFRLFPSTNIIDPGRMPKLTVRV